MTPYAIGDAPNQLRIGRVFGPDINQRGLRPAHKILYTPEEAAELLSMSRTRLYALLGRKVIASIKEGRARLVPGSALDAYVRRRLQEQH
jgi:excisionase family DNA binding protein